MLIVVRRCIITGSGKGEKEYTILPKAKKGQVIPIRQIVMNVPHELRARVFTSKSLRICASAVPDKLNFVKCGINEFETQIQDKKEIPYLVRKIVEAGEDIYSVNLIEPTLEDIYFTLTAGRKED